MKNSSIKHKLVKAAAKAISKAPEALVELQKPVVNERGFVLEPRIALSLNALKATGNKDFCDVPVEVGRKIIDNEADYAVTRHIAVDNVEDTAIAGVHCRVYSNKAHRNGRTIVYLHGGGWVLGSLESHDITCRYLANMADAKVISVNYRLAPEHPFPAALTDVNAVLDVLLRESSRVILMGDSAGGNLTLTSTISRIQAGLDLPMAIVPLVPVTNLDAFDTGSYQEFETGFFLTKKQMEWYRNHYLGELDTKDPLVSPIFADQDTLLQFPPSYTVVAGFDPLRDEGEAMFEKLRSAGWNATLQVAESQVHPFVNSITMWEGAEKAMHDVALWIINAFHDDFSRRPA